MAKQPKTATSKTQHISVLPKPAIHKIPREHESPSELLTIRQVMNIIRQMHLDIYGKCIPSISASESGEILIANKFRLVQDQGTMTWSCHVKIESSPLWSEMLPMTQKDPLEYIQRIVGWFSNRETDLWMMINYFCMA